MEAVKPFETAVETPFHGFTSQNIARFIEIALRSLDSNVGNH
jgi:hypothetical protein